jgi:hypothetical protein
VGWYAIKGWDFYMGWGRAMSTLKRLLIPSAILLGCCLVVAALGIVYNGYLCADELLIQPQITSRLAYEAIGDGGELIEFCDYGRGSHRYIFTKGGARVDVDCKRDQNGKWATSLTKIDP